MFPSTQVAVFVLFQPASCWYFFQSTLRAEDGGISNKSTRNTFLKNFEEEVTCFDSPHFYSHRKQRYYEGAKRLLRVYFKEDSRLSCITSRGDFTHSLSKKVKTIECIFVDLTSAFKDLTSKTWGLHLFFIYPANLTILIESFRVYWTSIQQEKKNKMPLIPALWTQDYTRWYQFLWLACMLAPTHYTQKIVILPVWRINIFVL